MSFFISHLATRNIRRVDSEDRPVLLTKPMKACLIGDGILEIILISGVILLSTQLGGVKIDHIDIVNNGLVPLMGEFGHYFPIVAMAGGATLIFSCDLYAFIRSGKIYRLNEFYDVLGGVKQGWTD
jgi:hypothetical protein